MESKEERFVRVTTKRTNDIIDKIRIIGNCSNRNTYKYTEKDVNKIFKAINDEIKKTKSKFLSKQKKFSF